MLIYAQIAFLIVTAFAAMLWSTLAAWVLFNKRIKHPRLQWIYSIYTRAALLLWIVFIVVFL